MQYFSIKKSNGKSVQYGIDTTKISKEFINKYLERLDLEADNIAEKNQQARTDLYKLRDEDKALDLNFTKIQPQYYVVANNIARRINEARNAKREERSLLLQQSIQSSSTKIKEPESESKPKSEVLHPNLKNIFSPDRTSRSAKEAKAFNAQVASLPILEKKEEEMAGQAVKLKDHLKSLPKWDESFRNFESFLDKFEMYFDIAEITKMDFTIWP